MIRIELSALINHLHPIGRHVIETAAAECVSQQHAEITVAQVLKHMLQTPLCDTRTILAKGGVDTEALLQQLSDNLHNPAMGSQSYPSFSPLLVEWLQDGWLLGSSELQHTQLRTGALLMALIYSPQRYLTPQASRLLTPLNRSLIMQQFAEWTADSAESDVPQGNAAVQAAEHSASLLDRYTHNLTEQARSGKLDPVLCRDKEIDLMIDILCRRRKNNPIVVGEAGVGKSALIEGLALRIIAQQVPEKLLHTELRTLDLGALQAGAAVKGEFEKRMKGIMAEVSQSPTPVILFIDEAHTLIGTGNQQGGLDISNLLKPALARGELKTIAATTWSEYKKYFEKDAALSRRFQLVKVAEPSAQEATIILRGLRSAYESAHGVLIDDDALQAAAQLSDRYLSGRQLPDKAIDVLDTACARVAINLTSPPKAISALNTQLHQLTLEIQLLTRQQRIGLGEDAKERLTLLQQEYQQTEGRLTSLQAAWQQQQACVLQIVALRKQLLADPTEVEPSTIPVEHPAEIDPLATEMAALSQLNQQLAQLQQQETLVSPHVNRQQITEVIAEWTGVPLNRLSQNELAVVTELPRYLEKEIKGQDTAIACLHRHLLTARADLRRPGRPLGAFLLVGPSGVGKTETVLQIADLLFGGRSYLTTINMSEFQEKHTVSRLIGSPPGYVGYGEGGVLTEAIRQKPYSVVLLDEVEKAHPDVLNLFYQAFDKGEMADGEGQVIDCKNVVFFLTSNLGYQTIVDHAQQPEGLIDLLYPELAAFFKPALLARMEVIPYLPLTQDTLVTIIQGKLQRLEHLLHERFGAEVVIEPEVYAEILLRATRAENGARMLESIIDGALLPPVSLLLLQKIAADESISHIRFTVEQHNFSAQVEGAA